MKKVPFNVKLGLLLFISIIFVVLYSNISVIRVNYNEVLKYFNDSFRKEGVNLNIDENQVYFCTYEKCVFLDDITSKVKTKLPDNLIIPPGEYDFFGKTYELKHQGVYRFMKAGLSYEQRIVSIGNIDTLLSSIGWIVSHGNNDNKLSTKDLMLKATHSKLVLTCGEVSRFAQDMLNSQGFTSRRCLGLTLDQWNTYDNGHTLLEVFDSHKKKWVVYDLDNNRFFSNSQGQLSFLELAIHVLGDKNFKIEQISNDTKVALTDGYSSFDFYSEAIAANDSTLYNWYKRVFQVQMIEDGNKFVFHDLLNRDRILSYSSNFVLEENCDDFLEYFYSKDKDFDELQLKCK
jgi:hypothetical protein